MNDNFTKTGFIMYTVHWPCLSVLSDADLGKLLKNVFLYHIDGSIPKLETEAMRAIFNLIKQRMDKDREKYIKVCQRNRKIAKDYHKQKHGNQQDTNQTHPDVTDNDNIIDINNKYDIRQFLRNFSKIRGKKFNTGSRIQQEYAGCCKMGFTPQDMLEALRNAMKDETHVLDGFSDLTPYYFCRKENLAHYLGVKIGRNASNTGKAQGDNFGPGEFVRDGRRFYRYMNAVYDVPPNAGPRPGKGYVYDLENGKWRLAEK